MGITLGSNFTVNTALPLDDRNTVADLTARDAIDSGRRYLGLEVFVVSNSKKYTLKSGITNSDWVELTSGSGGGSPQWFSGPGGAVLDIDSITELKVWIFGPSTSGDPSQNNYISMSAKRSPDQASSTTQKFLRFSFYSITGANITRFTAVTTLIKAGMSAAATTYTNTASVDTTASVVRGYLNVQVALSDTGGLIGGAAFEPGDMIKIKLSRSTPGGTEDTGLVHLIDGTTELKME